MSTGGPPWNTQTDKHILTHGHGRVKMKNMTMWDRNTTTIHDFLINVGIINQDKHCLD